MHIWSRLTLLFCLCLVLIGVFGSPVQSRGDVLSFANGHFTKCRVPLEHPTLYVSIQGTPYAKPLERALQKKARELDFTLTSQPSSADCILQATLVFGGIADESALREAVDRGYDEKSSIGGTKNFGVVADLLLVIREVPVAKDDTQLMLKNISQRLTLSSSTMRIGFCAKNRENTLTDPFVHRFSEIVLSHMTQALER
ncbi:MAG: hypothetical protein IJS54_03630 [Desulfovibrio sp.]|nr:hypothetical protein [Desulfovibrio sp.]